MKSEKNTIKKYLKQNKGNKKKKKTKSDIKINRNQILRDEIENKIQLENKKIVIKRIWTRFYIKIK
jgi:hypothetical protein